MINEYLRKTGHSEFTQAYVLTLVDLLIQKGIFTQEEYKKQVEKVFPKMFKMVKDEGKKELEKELERSLEEIKKELKKESSEKNEGNDILCESKN